MKHIVIVLALLAAFLAGLAVPLLLGGKDGPRVDPFTDTAGHPYAAQIEEIRLAGLTAGCQTEPPMFCPDRPLTRGEAAVLLSRILER